MNKKVLAILILILCVTIPILTLSLFPTPCGYGLCLILYYPIIFITGGLSAWVFYKFHDKVKVNSNVLFLIVLLFDISVLTYFYPKGEYFPTNQLQIAKQVANDYEKLKPIDLFKATEDRDFLRITALYHKFNLPTEIYEVRYCFIDEKGSCDTMYRDFNYFIMNNQIVTNNPDFNYNLDPSEGSFSFADTIDQIDFQFKVGYPDFGKYRKSFTNTSSEISESETRVTGLVKDIESLRVIVDENKPKFEYGFTKLFERYLSLRE